MKIRLGDVNPKAEPLLPPTAADGSGVGANYADAYVKSMKLTLEDGRKILCTRRGLKLTLKIGKAQGEGLLRRLDNGPDPRDMLRLALETAADGVGAEFTEEDGALWLEMP